jgi:hypothetical protein
VLAVGGQNSDIYVWSLKDQKLIRSFGTNAIDKADDVQMNDCNQEPMEIIDINWSNDGTMISSRDTQELFDESEKPKHEGLRTEIFYLIR